MFFLLILIKSFYAMENDRISSQRVANFLQNTMGLKTKVYFNTEAKNTNPNNKLNINISTSQANLFFFYGKKLNLFLKRIEEEKYQNIIEEAKRYNKNNNIVIETPEQWNQRKKKNQNKFSFIPIETTEQSDNIFNYQVFLNALNNAISDDNKDIKEPVFSCKINNGAYQEKYEKMPDNLKKLIKIYPEDFVEFIKIFEKNDNDEYEQIQHSIAIQKESEEKKIEEQEKKRKEIEEYVHKGKEKYFTEKRKSFTNIIDAIINIYLDEVNKKFKNKNKISVEHDLNVFENYNIVIGKTTRNFLSNIEKFEYIDIFKFLESLIPSILKDSNNQDVMRSIESDISKKNLFIPDFIIALPDRLYRWTHSLITENQLTLHKERLGLDRSYTRDELEEIAVNMAIVKTEELKPYIKRIIDLEK